MSEETIRVGSPNAERWLGLEASPDEITAGGIVQLVATQSGLIGGFDVTWRVEGPVALPGGWAGHHQHHRPTPRVPDSDGPIIRATLDTAPLAVGQWTVRIELTPTDEENDPEARDGATLTASDQIRVAPRPFAAGDDVSVTMRRAAVAPTTDQALWVSIRNSTNNLGFDPYIRFIDRVWHDSDPTRSALNGFRRDLRRVERRTALPFPHVERYRLLKAATEVFLMINVGPTPATSAASTWPRRAPG